MFYIHEHLPQSILNILRQFSRRMKVMQRRSIRNHLIFNSLVLILLPLSAFAIYIFWYIYSANPDDFSHLLFILSAAFIVTASSAIILSVNLAEKFTAPLETMTTVARRIAAGRLTERVHVRTGSEIDILALALNNLASRLEDKLEEISAEKQKLQLILEHMDNAVLLFDSHGCLLEANRSAFLWFSLSPSMFGQRTLNVLGSSQFDSALRDALQSDRLSRHTLRINQKGTRKVFQASLVGLPAKTTLGKTVLAVFYDITNMTLLQERQADFVANASHELSTPLTAIRGFAETLVDGAADNAEDSRKFASIILSEAERMQRLVQELLQLAKIESAEYRQQIVTAPVHVQPIMTAVAAELATAWQHKKLSLSVEHPAEALMAQATPDWLKQILVNLVDNAIKYTPDGGTVLLAVAREGDRLQFTVRDSGVGIPAEDLPRIFDRFYRIDKARSRAVGGTGLGLAIVKYLVDALGGTIEVTSTPTTGTTFTFTLPAAPSPA